MDVLSSYAWPDVKVWAREDVGSGLIVAPFLGVMRRGRIEDAGVRWIKAKHRVLV